MLNISAQSLLHKKPHDTPASFSPLFHRPKMLRSIHHDMYKTTYSRKVYL